MSEQLSEQHMDIFLLAAPQAGIEHSVLVSNLAAAFKKDAAAIEKMLSRPRTMVKADVTPDIASKYKVLIEKSGGQCELVVREQAVVVASEEPVPPVVASVQDEEPVSVTDADQAPPADQKTPPVATTSADQPKLSLKADQAAAVSLEKSEFAQLQALASESLAAENQDDDEVKGDQNSSVHYDGEGDNSDAACYCVKCGTVIRVGQTQCPKCFTPVTESTSKNKTTASLLAFFIGGIVVALIVVIGFSLMTAVIEIPAYQDHSNRKKIEAAKPQVQESLDKVAAFIKKNQTYPSDNQMVGLPEQSGNGFIESINVQDGAIVQVVYRLSGDKENNIILWIPTEHKGEIIWDCKRGTLPDKYRPKQCRSGDAPINRELETVAADTVLSQKIYSGDKHVSLLVPATWEARELLPGAAIGAAKLLDENYVVVLADPKINFDENLTLEDYSRTVQLQLADNIKNGMVQGDVEFLTVAGFPAEQFLFPGVVGGVKISYVVTLIHGDTHFYRVLAWTLQARMDKNKKLLKSISESIKIY